MFEVYVCMYFELENIQILLCGGLACAHKKPDKNYTCSAHHSAVILGSYAWRVPTSPSFLQPSVNRRGRGPNFMSL